jgi:hypothetical protein
MARLFSKSCEASGLGDSDHMCTQRGLHSGGSAKNQLADCAAATHLQKKRCHALPAELANALCAGLMDRRESRLGEAALLAKRSAQNDQRSARTASLPRKTQPRSSRVNSRLLCDKVSSGKSTERRTIGHLPVHVVSSENLLPKGVGEGLISGFAHIPHTLISR